MGVSAVIALVATLAIFLVIFFKLRFSYWARRGIPHETPKFPVGSMTGFMKSRHYRDILKDYYDKYKHTGPWAGLYFFMTPTVFIFDLDLARDILIKNFNNFSDRGLFSNVRDDPLTGNLFNLDGPKWRVLRNKLSPTFTSGKMKFMFPTVMSVGAELRDNLAEVIEKDPVVEIKDLMARYTVDVIGTCAFGIECNSLKDKEAEFQIMGKKAFELMRHSKLIQAFMFSFPKLARKLRMRCVHEDIHQFFMRVVRKTVEYREEHNIKRNDFMNLLIELKNSEEGMSVEEIAAQAFIFFIAGFETSSTTMSFLLFELAVNQDIQERMRAEIVEKLEEYNGQFTYECMMELTYMDQVIKETLRKYSVVVALMRRALNEYPLPDRKYTIPKGAFIMIPCDAIHRDPDIYPDPEKFDPDRFKPEAIMQRHSCSWLPFGDGSRNCIAKRFGQMKIVIGLAMLLKNYKFYYSDRTPNPLVLDPKNSVPAAKDGIYLHVESI